jgi:hypothetical protein
VTAGNGAPIFAEAPSKKGFRAPSARENGRAAGDPGPQREPAEIAAARGR